MRRRGRVRGCVNGSVGDMGVCVCVVDSCAHWGSVCEVWCLPSLSPSVQLPLFFPVPQYEELRMKPLVITAIDRRIQVAVSC